MTARHGLAAAIAMASLGLSLASACGRPAVFVPPASAGAPAPEAQSIWTPLAESCRAVTSYRAEFGLTGQVGDRRIRGLAGARLNAALSANGDIGLEAIVSGQLVFRLGGSAGKAVLLLRDPDRVATARPEDILDALIGVRVGSERLLGVVAGCVTRDTAITRAVRHDQMLEIAAGDATVYLVPLGSGWQVRAGRFGDVLVDYGGRANGAPREIRLESGGNGRPRVSLDLRVQTARTNVDVDAALFRVTIPDNASTISLDELRQAGPLGESAGDSGR